MLQELTCLEISHRIFLCCLHLIYIVFAILPLKPRPAKANSLWQKDFWSCYFNLKVYIPVRGQHVPSLYYCSQILFFQSLHTGLKGSCSSRQITSECSGSPPAPCFLLFICLFLCGFLPHFFLFSTPDQDPWRKEERHLDTMVMGDLIKTQTNRQGYCNVSFTLSDCATAGWKHRFYK